MKQIIELMTAEIGAGAQITGCLRGPRALIDAGIVASLRDDGHDVREGRAVRDVVAERIVGEGKGEGKNQSHGHGSEARRIHAFHQDHDHDHAHGHGHGHAYDHDDRPKMAAVQAFVPSLAETVRQAAAKGHFPLVLGGDHSCAVGTWSGVAEAYKHGVGRDGDYRQGSIGLIWIDAHLDSHTPETSESQAPHGMPLAALLGEGEQALTSVFGWRQKIAAENAVVIGARSYEEGEVHLLERLGVRVILMNEVARRGMADCLNEAVRIASAGTVGYGISFDVDAIDPAEAPGVGSPEELGLGVTETVAALTQLRADPRLIGFELVEYNPDLDDAECRTAAVCKALLHAVLDDAGSKVVVTAPRQGGFRAHRRSSMHHARSAA